MEQKERRSPQLTEKVTMRLPGGTLAAIAAAAARERMTVAEWRRRALRHALERSERKGAR